MNPDSVSIGTEKTHNSVLTFVKWFVGLAAVLGILGTIFWAVFYWDYTANLSFVIPTRIWYQNTYWNAEGLFMKPVRKYPPFDPIYTIQISEYNPATPFTYTYSFWGSTYKFDPNNKIMLMKGVNGKIYAFRTDDTQTSPSAINIQIYGTGKSIITETTWSTNSNLFQIEKDYSKNPDQPLNTND